MGSLGGHGWVAVIGGGPYIACGIAGLCRRPRTSARRPVARRAAREIAGASPDTGERYRGGGGRRFATAAAVAVSGVIGFVGLIGPPSRPDVRGRYRHRYLIPASGFTGAILLLLADDLARTVAAPVELPVGVLTAILGGPFFWGRFWARG